MAERVINKTGGSSLGIQVEPYDDSEVSGNRPAVSGSGSEAGTAYRTLGGPIQRGEAAGFGDFDIVEAAVRPDLYQQVNRTLLPSQASPERVHRFGIYRLQRSGLFNGYIRKGPFLRFCQRRRWRGLECSLCGLLRSRGGGGLRFLRLNLRLVYRSFYSRFFGGRFWIRRGQRLRSHAGDRSHRAGLKMSRLRSIERHSQDILLRPLNHRRVSVFSGV
jgi:hypothetical protein